MAGPQPIPLAELEKDALTEIANISMGRAATSLGQMVNREVRLAVPSVELVSADRAAQIVAQSHDVKLIAVRQDLRACSRAEQCLFSPKRSASIWFKSS
jgi:chemotaxis protein CheC